MSALRGVYTALVTPFGPSGRLRYDLVPRLLEFQRQAGVDGVLVAGTNGEGPSLSVTERKRLLETVLAHAHGLDVIAGTGACALPDAQVLTRHASRCGVSAVLALPPFYFRNAGPDGLVAYYRAVAAASRVPVILYSIPQFTGVDLEPTLSELKGVPRIVAVKESSPSPELSYRVLEHHPELSLFVGNDAYLAELLARGAAGVISGTANAFPELLVAVYRAFQRGEDTSGLQARLNAAVEILTKYPVVANVKTILAERGIGRIYPRPPLTLPPAAARRSLLRQVRQAGLLPSKPRC